MKRFKAVFVAMFCSMLVQAQDYYWVFFKDKVNTEFNPYEYFDQKAIERRMKNGLSLYDISDYPLNSEYVKQITNIADSIVGETRWYNAIAIASSQEKIEYIKEFSFVEEVVLISGKMQSASYDRYNDFDLFIESQQYEYSNVVESQLKRMQGNGFISQNIDGKGLRIAVFDTGFPNVDKHPAFKHLRDNNQIVKTWNFPKNEENVYGWHSHGTMVLSCITGMSGNINLGLATGSEFLLARTEVNSEPEIEEVWWVEALEWADKNGADIINSSLGYCGDRHNTNEMDGKTTIVSRAASLAASKGILLCNAAGNEGENNSWLIMGAPADADNILTVGGIEMDKYLKTSFSSIGPTVDGRLKPNVCAFGHAKVAKSSSNDTYTTMSGTSFSSPLVAGFAACAWQTKRELTALEIKEEIEKSADLYPYFDYFYGYGVPQASYFINTSKKQINKTFEFITDSLYIYIKPLQDGNSLLFYHIENENGVLDFYTQIVLNNDLAYANDSEYDDYVGVDKTLLLGNKTLRVFYKGYVDIYKLSEEELISVNSRFSENNNNLLYKYYNHKLIVAKDVTKQKISNYGINSKYYLHLYVSCGMFLKSKIEGYSLEYNKSNSFNIGLRYKYNLKKYYAIGANIEIGKTRYDTKGFPISEVSYYEPINLPSTYKLEYSRVDMSVINLEFYQRIRLLSTRMLGMGGWLDLGIYGTYMYYNKYSEKYVAESLIINKVNLNSDNINWGLRVRFGYGILAMYGQYRISNIFERISELPKFSIGLELSLPIG